MENNLDEIWRECKRSLYRIRLQDKSAEVRRVALMNMGRAVEQFKCRKIETENRLNNALKEVKLWRAIAVISWIILAIGGAAYVIF